MGYNKNMRISYFVYMRKEENALDYLKKLTNSDFFTNNETSELTICFPSIIKDKNKIKALLKNKCDTFLIYSDEEITINDGFYKAVDHMEGDVCILLDSAVRSFAPLVKKCLEKHEKGARIIKVCRRYRGIKSFFHRIGQSIYGFFCRIFASKTDEGNVLSLGLIDKYVLDLMKTLPQKRCLMKNSSGLYDVPTATIYVDYKKLPKDTVTRSSTSDMRNFIIFTTLTPMLITIIVLLNIFTSPHIIINFALVLLTIFSTILACTSLPKHIFMCRNFPLNKIKIKEEKIEKK